MQVLHFAICIKVMQMKHLQFLFSLFFPFKFFHLVVRIFLNLHDCVERIAPREKQVSWYWIESFRRCWCAVVKLTDAELLPLEKNRFSRIKR